jgi:hypothetical protein
MKIIEFRNSAVLPSYSLQRGRNRRLMPTRRPCVEAASVNPSDVKNVAGRMPQTTLPPISGAT